MLPNATATPVPPVTTLPQPLPSSTVWWGNLSGLNDTPTNIMDGAAMVGYSPVLMYVLLCRGYRQRYADEHS